MPKDTTPKTPQKEARTRLEYSKQYSETPSSLRRADNIAADATLEQRREANIADIGKNVPFISVDEFLEAFVPKLPDGFDLDIIVDGLRKSATGRLVDKGWKDFLRRPAKSSLDEDTCFAPVKHIVNAIKTVCMKKFPARIPVTRSRSSFTCLPRTAPRSSVLSVTSKQDCYFTTREVTSVSVTWELISICGELKKDDDIYQNRKQIAWDMTRIMSCDPTRRSALGLTIEDTRMRLWYCDRAAFLASEEIDFNADYKKVIRFFAAALFAPLRQLGWDPTITPTGTLNQYDITVQGYDGTIKTYRTKELLFADKVWALRGRGTRAWRCRELRPDGKEDPDKGDVVVKDTWVDRHRDRERTINNRVFDSAATEEEREELRRGMLTVEHDGDVLIDGQVDYTYDPPENPLWLRLEPQIEHPRTRVHLAADFNATHKIRAGPSGPAVDDPIVCDQKVHYRIVFSDVGTTLERTRCLQRVSMALRRVTQLLSILHKLGWVHRDISVSNILLVGDEVKLADFEYAKKYDQTDSHVVRTVNCCFVPVEAESGEFEFITEYDVLDEVDEDDEEVDLTVSGITANLTFRYLPLHDLESVWWIAAYFVINFKLVRIGNLLVDPNPRTEEQTKIAKQLFTGRKLRSQALTSPSHFAESVGNALHPSISFIAAIFKTMLVFLGRHYRVTELEVARNSHLLLLGQGAYDKLANVWARLEKELNANCEGDVFVFHPDDLESPKGVSQKQRLGTYH